MIYISGVMMDHAETLSEMSVRSREVFRQVVERYLQSGDPVGSRTLTRTFSERISAATIRNVMQDLEHLGLIEAPHVSAGRIPTHQGLRMFIDGILEVENIDENDRKRIDTTLIKGSNGGVESLLDQVSTALSAITRGASLVLAPKQEAPIKHVEFIGLGPDRALVILVFADGQVENRVFTPPPGQTPSSLREATNFFNSLVEGHTLRELQTVMRSEIAARRQELNARARSLVESGIAVWQDEGERGERLMVRGRSNLLGEDEGSPEDLVRIRQLFDDLERKRDVAAFLELVEQGEGVRIFIGSENKLFSLSGSSLVISPYANNHNTIVGAVGVIGPTRLNYGRIVPIVNYTAQMVGRLISDYSRQG